MTERAREIRSAGRRASVTLVAALLLAAPAEPPASAAYGPGGSRAPACESVLPLVLNVGLPFMRDVPLESLESSLRAAIGDRYLESALCPCRPLRLNVALGSDYQVLDWLDRGLVDMAVVSVLGFDLLRNDGLDLLEVPGVGSGDMVQLVGREPRVEVLTGPGGPADDGLSGLDRVRELGTRLWLREIAGEEDVPDPGFLVVPSHLSTAGFLLPVLAIEEALDALPAARDATAEQRREFWRAFYDRLCFRFEPDLGRRDAACVPTPVRPGVEVSAFPVPPDDAMMAGPGQIGERVHRDLLVIRRGAAEAAFAPDTFPDQPAEPGSLRRLRALLSREGDRSGETVPTAFDGFLVPDAYFGTRTFELRVGETLDLVQLHQRIASRSSLSLVLPGGGVKAAYQSRVLDELYDVRMGGAPGLVNAGALTDFAGPSPVTPLRVDSVVGTSGGALLGFFVARLGPYGPVDLSDILWKPAEAEDPDAPYLTATEIFGWTDLPRYVSLVLVLCIFGVVLAFFSWRRHGFLSSERPRGRPAQVEAGAEAEAEPAPEPAVRWAVLLPLAALLVLTPPVVSWVSGPLADEHVPEFEGLLYAVLLVLATFADQCLVRREAHARRAAAFADAPIGKGPRIDLRGVLPTTLLVLGGFLVLAPVLVRGLAPGLVLGGSPVLEGRVTTGSAYLVLGSIAAGLGLLAVGWQRLRHLGWWNLLAWPAVFVVGTLLAWGILRLAGEKVLAGVDRGPLLFVALASALLFSVVVRLVTSPAVGRRYPLVDRVVTRVSAVARLLVGHRIAYFLGLGAFGFLGCLIVLDLTRPPAETFVGAGFTELLFAESKLDAPRGPLAVCLGAVFLLLGTVLTLHRRRNRYRMEQEDRYRDAVLVVVTGFAFAVYLTLWLVVRGIALVGKTGWLEGSALYARLSSLTLFELTPAFWKGLVVVSFVGACLVVRWAYVGSRRPEGTFSHMISDSLAFLCASHPNAHLVSQRVVRLGAMAIGGLVWWNFVLAPALYGNRYAFEYLEGAEARFDDAYRQENGASSYRLTARYLAPANALSIDGTRFVLAVPAGDECPAVPASPGVVWRRFRIAAGGAGEGTVPAVVRTAEEGRRCKEISLDDDDQRKELQNYIFASGSPFPAFPPKRVRVYAPDGEDDDGPVVREALVDGGYSNNVPIEAAAKIGARQALVIHSSNPRPAPSGEGWLARLGGPLVDNVPRLVGFLYERSQQLDRRSRSDLFVASLAPPAAADWPILTDFRSATVARMIEQAEKGLGRRIGMVESWGPPEFQSSLRIECGDEPAARPPGGSAVPP